MAVSCTVPQPEPWFHAQGKAQPWGPGAHITLWEVGCGLSQVRQIDLVERSRTAPWFETQSAFEATAVRQDSKIIFGEHGVKRDSKLDIFLPPALETLKILNWHGNIGSLCFEGPAHALIYKARLLSPPPRHTHMVSRNPRISLKGGKEYTRKPMWVWGAII